MNTPSWNQRFFASTRGRIIALLRRAGRTVNELAEALDLTDNAVRAHLTTLERDGLVQPGGVRRGVRKPHQQYDLTPEAEQFFPKAFSHVLGELLAALEEQMPSDARDALFRDAGRRLAAAYLPAAQGQGPAERRAVALQAFSDLGGLAEIKDEPGRFVLQGLSCPLAGLPAAHPEVCLLAETMLTEILGVPVQEQCHQSASPRCRFAVMPSQGTP